MQVVIDIDDEMYEQIVTNDDVYVLDDVDCILIENAIANGTPLPKGHGRLIDENQIPGDGGWDFSDRLSSTPTIIEADATDINVGSIESEE